ncbi:MAG: RNA-binding S4 domain-containing protein [Hyphomicrobiaceae bacterium]|nr:RNA-binding S4 domain-containing protein [Hyphomicrobiaceae bacterium]
MTSETSGNETASGSVGSQRLDKWLWFVRVVKTRTLAAGLVTEGRVRVNRERIAKPSHLVRAGDVVTVTVGPRVRILEVLAPGVRRGPPAEAQDLYRDLTPAREQPSATRESRPAGGTRDVGSGRPTKRDRRALDRLRSEEE